MFFLIIKSTAQSSKRTVRYQEFKEFEIKNLKITLPDNAIFRFTKRKSYIKGHRLNNHLDGTYGPADGVITKSEIQNTLRFLFIEFDTQFIPKLKSTNPVLKELDSTYPLYWLEYGSLLGSYRDQDIIPWDVDGDIGIFDFILLEFPMRFETTKWIFLRNADDIALREYAVTFDSRTTVSARFISKTNGVYIDVFAFSVMENTVNHQKYVYSQLQIRDFRLWRPLEMLLPINPNGTFLGNMTFNIPRDAEQWLYVWYDTLRAPAKLDPMDWYLL